jgi:hypothetical protein
MACPEPLFSPNVPQTHNAFVRWLWHDPTNWTDISQASQPVLSLPDRVCEDSEDIWLYHGSMNTTDGVHSLLDRLEKDNRLLVDHTVASVELKVLYYYTSLASAMQLRISFDRERGHDRFRLFTETDAVPLTHTYSRTTLATQVLCGITLMYQTTIIFHHIFRSAISMMILNERKGRGLLWLTPRDLNVLVSKFSGGGCFCLLRLTLFGTYLGWAFSSNVAAIPELATSGNLRQQLNLWMVCFNPELA